MFVFSKMVNATKTTFFFSEPAATTQCLKASKWCGSSSCQTTGRHFSLSFSAISFLKCSQFCVHEPDPVIRAGRLGAVTAPYPASPPSEPGQPRSGMGGPAMSCQTKCHMLGCSTFHCKIFAVLCDKPDPSPGLGGSALELHHV